MKTFEVEEGVLVVQTHRLYTDEGQLIYMERWPGGEWMFMDISRGISGVVKGIVVTRPFHAAERVVDRYDHNEYDAHHVKYDMAVHIRSIIESVKCHVELVNPSLS